MIKPVYDEQFHQWQKVQISYRSYCAIAKSDLFIRKLSDQLLSRLSKLSLYALSNRQMAKTPIHLFSIVSMSSQRQ